MEGTIEDCALAELHHYEEVVSAAEKSLVNMGYGKGLAVNYAPKLVNSFFDSDIERFLEQRSEPGLNIDSETKRLKDTVAKMHKDGVYITLEDYVELRHEYDKLRKGFSAEN